MREEALGASLRSYVYIHIIGFQTTIFRDDRGGCPPRSPPFRVSRHYIETAYPFISENNQNT